LSELHLFEAANEEAEVARRWYGERSEVAQTAFLRELDHAVTVVSEAPQRWPKYIGRTRRYVFPTFPYSLVYFVQEDVVHVVAIAHQSRRPGYWRERLRR
jgi:plasmid stabilization system protein ParE